jgi:hypothetical protein
MKTDCNYSYKLRPGYGSEELLLDFDAKNDPDGLQNELITMLEKSGFQLIKTADLWINGELLFTFSSNNGTLSFSRDNWDCFFILGENKNQADIIKLDQILSENPLFEKVIANYSDYR